VETLLSGGAFFEGPRWHDGRWWVSDFYRRVVLALDEDGRAETVLSVEGQPSGLGWLPDGSLLVVSMRDRRVLRRAPGGEVSVHADLSRFCGGPANDMVVGADGRAYVGNFGFDLLGGDEPRPTVLVRVDPDGSAVVAAEDLWFPNGSLLAPDGRTLIVAETFGARLTAFTVEDDGALGDRRVWAELGRASPDGCTLDAEGHVWIADPRGARCCRVAPGGAVVEELAAPEGLRFYACMLGGADGRTLLLCAAPDYEERKRTRRLEAVLLATRVRVPHAGWP
jgi:sugar lactone lactonase YvrE